MPVLEVATGQLIQELRSARLRSDQLFSILKSEALYERPIAERHRVIFYIGHLEGFDSIQICREALRLRSPDPEFDQLFQAGIDPDAGHLPSDTPADWPSLERLREYVKQCRRFVDENLERAPENVIHMAIEHRMMHLETLAYMFHNFSHDKKETPKLSEAACTLSTTEVQNEWREIPEGDAILGRNHDGSFGWDNEYEEVRTRIPAFRMQRYNVTNGEYRQFVKGGASIPHF